MILSQKLCRCFSPFRSRTVFHSVSYVLVVLIHTDYSDMPFINSGCVSTVTAPLNSDPLKADHYLILSCSICVTAILGAPLLELTVLKNYIEVTIKGPFRWRTKRTKKEKSLWKIFPHMIYYVSVFNSRSGHTVRV